MRKIVVIGISILSVFILCSLSYQPIIADTPIEQIVQVKESKASNLDVDELQELYNRLVELKSQSNDDCDCTDDIDKKLYPETLCAILLAIFWGGWYLLPIINLYLPIRFIVNFIVPLTAIIGIIVLGLIDYYECPGPFMAVPITTVNISEMRRSNF